MEKKKSFLALGVLILVLVIAYHLYGTLSKQVSAEQVSQETAQEVQAAPDFTVYDAAGNAVRLSEQFGKPIVLNFWASWCGPCQMEMPEFEEKYQELGESVAFMMVNVTDSAGEEAAAKEYVAKQAFTFPVYYDLDLEASGKYGVWSLPTTYFLDGEGNLIAQASGAINGETLQQGIDMIME
ncbi:MAG: TlpA disulfide reductase family protein [Bacillota bacterium]|nr:TlpA disulfide reductase family protein [Bacillota bacterium]